MHECNEPRNVRIRKTLTPAVDFDNEGMGFIQR